MTQPREPQDIGTGGGFPPRVWLHGSHWWLEPKEGDREYISRQEHTAALQQAREAGRREAAEILKNAAIATNSGKSFAELRRYLLTKREQLLSKARAALAEVTNSPKTPDGSNASALEKERDKWKDEYQELCKFATDYEEQRDALKAQLAIAKAALEKIAAAFCPIYIAHPQSVWWQSHVVPIASAALAQIRGEGKA